jgi:hypothetical protein
LRNELSEILKKIEGSKLSPFRRHNLALAIMTLLKNEELEIIERLSLHTASLRLQQRSEGG